jgi:predicted MFS family arabinose efflux permease
MGFDIRMPIGMLFTLFGILLIGYGAATNGSAMYAEHSLGVNMNLWWGVALLAFGLVMLTLTRLRRKQQPTEGEQKRTSDDL